MMKNNSIENRKKFNFLTKLVKGEKLAHKSSILEKKINIINESNPSETKFWNSIQQVQTGEQKKNIYHIQKLIQKKYTMMSKRQRVLPKNLRLFFARTRTAYLIINLNQLLKILRNQDIFLITNQKKTMIMKRSLPLMNSKILSKRLKKSSPRSGWHQQ